MKKFLILMVTALTLGACADNLETSRYETSAAGRINTVQEGVIISARPVTIATSDGMVGKIGGGLAGGIAGSTLGGGATAHALGAVGGAILGGYAGDKAQTALSKQDGMEYIVRLDSGRAISLTQGTDEIFRVGQPVYVLDASYGQRARIIAR